MSDAARRPTVALVAGAGGGIGAAITSRLAEVGHPVGLTDIDPTVLEQTTALVADVPHRSVTGDATDPDAVDRVVTEVEAALGPVGVLVNAVGVYGNRRRFIESDPADWWRVLEVNVRAPALLTRRVLPGMVARGRGHVVNLGSRAAAWDDPGGSSVAYSASKAALRRFTGAVAAEVDGTGVVVVDLSPGFVRTAMTASRPGIDELPAEAFLPASRAADHVAALVSGRYDVLHGRFVHVEDDLEALLADPGIERVGGAP